LRGLIAAPHRAAPIHAEVPERCSMARMLCDAFLQAFTRA